MLTSPCLPTIGIMKCGMQDVRAWQDGARRYESGSEDGYFEWFALLSKRFELAGRIWNVGVSWLGVRGLFFFCKFSCLIFYRLVRIVGEVFKREIQLVAS